MESNECWAKAFNTFGGQREARNTLDAQCMVVELHWRIWCNPSHTLSGNCVLGNLEQPDLFLHLLTEAMMWGYPVTSCIFLWCVQHQSQPSFFLNGEWFVHRVVSTLLMKGLPSGLSWLCTILILLSLSTFLTLWRPVFHLLGDFLPSFSLWIQPPQNAV